jgi:hypothetical protein
MKRYKKVCEACGSEELSFDANAYWNVSTQSFELDDMWETYCRNCEDTTYAIDKEIIELNTNTKVL